MSEIITSAIVIGDATVDFRFDRLPVEEQLYAVYCSYQGKEYCFHMMYDAPICEFRIIDSRNCPYAVKEASHLLSRAIEHYHA